MSILPWDRHNRDGYYGEKENRRSPLGPIFSLILFAGLVLAALHSCSDSIPAPVQKCHNSRVYLDSRGEWQLSDSGDNR